MKWKRLTACAVVSFCLAINAQMPTSELPSNYKPVFDNADVTVLRAHYGPHETVPVHDHPAYTTVFVYLNDSGVVRLSHFDGGTVTQVNRPPTHAGAFRVGPAHAERHSVENLGDVPADSVLVELKSQPAQAITEEFRGGAATQPLLSGTSVVYNNPALRIERVLCDPGATCELAAEAAPSVLVAITPTASLGGRAAQMLSMEQPVRWLAAGERSGMRSNGPAPAQVLRIVLIGK